MKNQEIFFSKQVLIKDILEQARSLKIEEGLAQMIAEKTANKIEIWAKKRAIIIQEELEQKIGNELAKFNKDLAYVYFNRGKII